MLIFQRPENVFWHFIIKSNGSYGPKPVSQEYTLTVTAENATTAAAEALQLQKNYTVNDDTPGFFMLQDIKKPRRIALRPEYALTDSMLNLHYGEGFAEWSTRFAYGLGQSGLSILRGSPGTGKTSYLRHLIFTLCETHRFYYLPVDAFRLLQAEIVGFLAKEKARYKSHVLVLVMEDAEQLLLDRKGHRDGLASSLLNFSDGFVGDIVSAHMICTINSEIKELDEAVLRPGRQRFFREFSPLTVSQSIGLAAALGIELKEKRAYTLAELYHFKDIQSAEMAAKPSSKPIGFLP
jgi:ATPase family associated with various cellular activities (AAA)